MTMRKLPSAKINVRPGLRSELAPAALDRWNSSVKSAADDSDNTISILDQLERTGLAMV